MLCYVVVNDILNNIIYNYFVQSTHIIVLIENMISNAICIELHGIPHTHEHRRTGCVVENFVKIEKLLNQHSHR
jgi:hypothetical protein